MKQDKLLLVLFIINLIKSQGDCPEHCNCDESNICISCKGKFYDISTNCTTPCPSNCQTCTSAEECGNCESGFYGTICDKSCEKGCDISYSNCAKSSGECERCVEFKYWGTKCETSCSSTCVYEGGKGCNKETSACDECISGTFGVLSCDEKCSEGCDLSQGNCDRTTGNCKCKQGFYSADCSKKCEEISEGCLDCIQDGNCTRCDANYYLSSGKCYKCGENCQGCTSGDKCTECKDEKTYGDLCDLTCPEHCSYTSGNRKCDRDTGKCSSCEQGFIGEKCEDCILSKFGALCNETCQEGCDLDKGNCERTTGKCTCKKGFYGETCNAKCSDKSEGCLDCTVDGTCIQCDENYFLKDGVCVKCGENCQGCTSAERCLECKDEKTYGDLCNLTCPDYCTYTEGKRKCDRDTGKCNECEPGFTGEKCEDCILTRFGALCNETCQEGCDLDKGNCERTSGNCTCKKGFFEPDCSKNCSEKSEGCIECLQIGGNCFECDPNYYLKDNQCYKCEDACIGCIVGGDCKECRDPTTFGARCNINCPTHCYYNETEKERKCDQTSGNCLHGCENEFMQGEKCEECKKGRFKEDCLGECNPGCDLDKENCKKDTGACYCKDGYYGTDCGLNCSSLSEGCKKCAQEDGKCLECEKDYYLSDGKCFKCGEYCDGCQNGTYCTECKDQERFGDLCEKKCPEHCSYNKTYYLKKEFFDSNDRKCDRKTGDCLSCETHFQGKICDECELKYFRELCNETCQEGCDLDKGNCERTTGNCTCKTKYFKADCSGNCPKNCDFSAGNCDKENGNCLKCNKGFFKADCAENCKEGCDLNKGNCEQISGNCTCKTKYFKADCSGNCPKNCDFSAGNCDVETGNCIKCDEGFFKADCSETCPENCDLSAGNCDKDTGKCVKCKDGYYGEKCETPCFPGCEKCDKETGKICEKCEMGKYGIEDCNSTCSPGCNLSERNCDIKDGACVECLGNHTYGIKCDLECTGCDSEGCDKAGKCRNIECVEGKYGIDCSLDCNCEGPNVEKTKKNETEGGIPLKSCSRFSGQCLHCLFGYYGSNSCKEYCNYKCHSLSCCTFGRKQNNPNFDFKIDKSRKMNMKIQGIDFELEIDFTKGYPITILSENRTKLNLTGINPTLRNSIETIDGIEIIGDLYQLDIEIKGTKDTKTFPGLIFVPTDLIKVRQRDIISLGFYNQFTEDLIKYEKEKNNIMHNFISFHFTKKDDKEDDMNIRIGDLHEENKEFYDKYYSCQIIKSEKTADILKSEKSCKTNGIKLSIENEAFVLDATATFSFIKESSFQFESKYDKFFKIHYLDQYCSSYYNETKNKIINYYCEKSLNLDRISDLGIIIENKVYYVSGKSLFTKVETEKGEAYKFKIDICEPKENKTDYYWNEDEEDKTMITLGKDFYFEKEYAAINNEEGKILVFNKKPEFFNGKLNPDLTVEAIKMPLTATLAAAIILIVIFVLDVSLFLCYWLYKKKKVKGKFLEVLN